MKYICGHNFNWHRRCQQCSVNKVYITGGAVSKEEGEGDAEEAWQPGKFHTPVAGVCASRAQWPCCRHWLQSQRKIYGFVCRRYKTILFSMLKLFGGNFMDEFDIFYLRSQQMTIILFCQKERVCTLYAVKHNQISSEWIVVLLDGLSCLHSPVRLISFGQPIIKLSFVDLWCE